MKLKTKIIAGAATLALLTIAASDLQAQVTNLITITATASLQGNDSYNTTNRITAAPTIKTMSTKQILAFLAFDENAEGIYMAGTNFPSGAKLVVINGSDGIDFQVLDKNNHFLVDVSDIISAQPSGTFEQDIDSGKQNYNFPYLASPTTTDRQIFTFTFDDTLIGGGDDIQFYLTGLLKNTTTDTTPNKNTGAYKETQSHTMTSGAGDGNFQDTPLVITGGFTASGSANLNTNSIINY